MHQKGTIFGGALLVAGTAIGGGILGLPVLTSQAGFIPAVLIYLVCWLFMASTGLLFLEVSQWMEPESNILSMAEKTLGKSGRAFVWALYLFLFYCLMIAYLIGCGAILTEITQHRMPNFFGPVFFAILFFPLIFIATLWVSRLNIWLFFALALSYLGFVILGYRYIQPELLKIHDWSYSMKVLPIAFISFAYQGIVPTLAHFMHYDFKSIRKAILIGSFIPLIAYIIWEALILGIVPLDGPHGLQEALNAGQNAVMPLKYFIDNDALYWMGQAFAFFALITSLLGVSLGLRDFLADGLSIQKNAWGKCILALLVLLPPLFVAVSYPNIFLIALDYAGGFGSALLLGLLPIVMVWRGRYSMRFPSVHQLPGGKFILSLLIAFVLIELVGEVRQLLARF